MSKDLLELSVETGLERAHALAHHARLRRPPPMCRHLKHLVLERAPGRGPYSGLGGSDDRLNPMCLGLYKILFYFEAFVHETIFVLVPPPIWGPTRLQWYCTTVAQYTFPPRHPCCMPYTIQYWYWQYRVKAKVCRHLKHLVLESTPGRGPYSSSGLGGNHEFESHGGCSWRERFAAGSVGGRHPVVSPARTPVLLLARREVRRLDYYQR